MREITTAERQLPSDRSVALIVKRRHRRQHPDRAALRRPAQARVRATAAAGVEERNIATVTPPPHWPSPSGTRRGRAHHHLLLRLKELRAQRGRALASAREHRRERCGSRRSDAPSPAEERWRPIARAYQCLDSDKEARGGRGTVFQTARHRATPYRRADRTTSSKRTRWRRDSPPMIAPWNAEGLGHLR